MARLETIIDALVQAIKARLPREHHVTLEVEGIAMVTAPKKG